MDWERVLGRVSRAAGVCNEADLAGLRIDEPDFALEIRRSPRTSSLARMAAAPVEASTNGAVGSADPPTVLRAEFVGIVHFTRPAVAQGTIVDRDRELAYVESLGIRNPVHSHAAGRIVAVYVNDRQAVEFGQPLFAIAHRPAEAHAYVS